MKVVRDVKTGFVQLFLFQFLCRWVVNFKDINFVL